MTTVLITLGDSWPAGAELNPGEKKYGELLQQRLGYDKFYNYAQSGSSNEHMLLQLQQYIQNDHNPGDHVTAVFFLTNPHRTIYFPKDGGFNVFGPDKQHWNSDAREVFMKNWLYFHENELLIFRNSIAITSLQQWCKVADINDYYFSGWVKYDSWLPMVDTDKIWAQGKETAADWFGASKHNGEHLLEISDNQFIKPNFAHPNQLGHQLIADKLADWIQNK